jgi:hypothetical protein
MTPHHGLAENAYRARFIRHLGKNDHAGEGDDPLLSRGQYSRNIIGMESKSSSRISNFDHQSCLFCAIAEAYRRESGHSVGWSVEEYKTGTGCN